MLVVGLGNPGQKYVHTRHNIGRDILLEIVLRGDFSEWRTDKYANASVSEGFFGQGEDTQAAYAILPLTFMNQSGEVLRVLVKKYNTASSDVILIHDDIDLPLGKVKISKDRGDGGHNGVKSVVEHLNTKDFIRIRIGICPIGEDGEKKKPDKEAVARFVLGHLGEKEEEAFESMYEQALAGLKLILKEGVESAMNHVNE